MHKALKRVAGGTCMWMCIAYAPLNGPCCGMVNITRGFHLTSSIIHTIIYKRCYVHIIICQAVFLSCCRDCPSFPAHLNSIGWAAIKKYSLKTRDMNHVRHACCFLHCNPFQFHYVLSCLYWYFLYATLAKLLFHAYRNA